MTANCQQSDFSASESFEAVERGASEADQLRADGLSDLRRLCDARTKGYEREHARLRTKLGAEHPRVLALQKKITTNQALSVQLGLEADRARTPAPPVDETTFVLQGRVLDKNWAGVPALTVALFDCKGARVEAMGYAYTQDNGYFQLVYCRAPQSPAGPVFIRLLNRDREHVFVDDRALYPAAGLVDYREIYLESTDPVGTPPEVDSTAPALQQPRLAELKLMPDRVEFGEIVRGTVSLSAPAPAQGAVVALSILANADVANIPANVTVPAGETSAAFSIVTNKIVGAACFEVAIQASFEGVERSATLTVGQVPGTEVRLDSVILDQTELEGGQKTKGRVKLTSAEHGAPVSVELWLSQPDQELAAVKPAVVAVPENRDVGEFAVTTRRVLQRRSITIHARYQGESREADLLLLPRRSTRTG